MKFLANENFPAPSIRILRNAGYFVDSIAEKTPGITDKAVLEKAALQQLIILTFDRDYGELIYKYKKETPPSLFIFETKEITRKMQQIFCLKYLQIKTSTSKIHLLWSKTMELGNVSLLYKRRIYKIAPTFNFPLSGSQSRFISV